MSAPWVIYGTGGSARWVPAESVPAIPAKSPRPAQAPRGERLQPGERPWRARRPQERRPRARLPQASRGERRPFPMEALEKAVRSGNERDTAFLLGVSQPTVRRLRMAGLSVDQADAYAVRAGMHPMEVWRTWPD